MTSDFQEIKGLIESKKILKNKMSHITRRLKTLELKYDFLEVVVGVKVNGEKLERAITTLFREIGFENVKKIGNKRKEDIRIYFEESDTLLLIEVTGTKNTHANDDKTRQITKHISDNKNNFKNVVGLFIMNNDFEKDVAKRVQNPFSSDQIRYAENDNYSLITSYNFIYGFCQVKNGKISLKDFENELLKTGEIKFNKNKE